MPDSEVLQTEEVFTPSTVARKTFVDRSHVGDRLKRELRVIGRPISLVGPYGCGKTTLALIEVERIFPRQIHVICKRSTTFDQLLLDSLDVLGPYYDQEHTHKAHHSPALTAEFMGLKAHLGGKSHERGATETRVLPPQLTSRSLARFAADAEAPWIIDDIHKLADSELVKVAESMREWQTAVFDTVPPKMIVIGTDPITAALHSRLMSAAPDLNRRLASLTLALMTDEELEDIIITGSELLNVDFSDVMQTIVEYSYGYPGICHDLCYHVCYAADVHMTTETTLKFEPEHMQAALEAYVEDVSPAIKQAFAQIRSHPIVGLPSAFASLVFENVAAGKLEGVDLHGLQRSVADALQCSEHDVLRGLDILSDDTAVLIINPEAGSVQFKEPMYLAHYEHRRDAASSKVTNEAFITKFFEIMRNKDIKP